MPWAGGLVRPLPLVRHDSRLPSHGRGSAVTLHACPHRRLSRFRAYAARSRRGKFHGGPWFRQRSPPRCNAARCLASGPESPADLLLRHRRACAAAFVVGCAPPIFSGGQTPREGVQPHQACPRSLALQGGRGLTGLPSTRAHSSDARTRELGACNTRGPSEGPLSHLKTRVSKSASWYPN